MTPRAIKKSLQDCQRKLRERAVTRGAPAWLLENLSFLQSEIRETLLELPASFVRGLPHSESGNFRIYEIAKASVPEAGIGADSIEGFQTELKARRELKLGELWAFGGMLRLVLLERLCAEADEVETIAACVRSLRALDEVPWKDFVESVSAVHEVLCEDPAHVYGAMDFATRDRYRHAIEGLAKGSKRSEEAVARAAVDRASNFADLRRQHVGFYLAGPGLPDFRRDLGCKPSLVFLLRDLLTRQPARLYVSSILALTGALIWLTGTIAGQYSLWLLPLLLLPASQAAIEAVNAIMSRLLAPRSLPVMDFSEGIPAAMQTIVVVPTLLLSERNVDSLLENLEIRYLANREPNLLFALLTDFADAEAATTVRDEDLVARAVQGIEVLNTRYAGSPFYLFHRKREWNPAEGRWMGEERKRGKLNDLNRFLLNRGNVFDRVAGDVPALSGVRYIITLDTDTQLPRDTAAKLIAAMAHPLNFPIFDPQRNTVVEGYALIQPRVAVSMESGGRSRLAKIFSGQPGFDPYATAVSDTYQDLNGQASFVGKGIYDLQAFERAVGDRFPVNTILSHDLIEGEHARTGLLTSVEVIEDYPATYAGFCKRKHRWIRGDWQIAAWILPRVRGANGEKIPNPLRLLSRWKIFDNLRRSTVEIALVLSLLAGWALAANPERWTAAILMLLLAGSYVDLLLTIVRAPERRFWRAFVLNIGSRFATVHRDALLNLAVLPHQALLNGDAIVRSLLRRHVTHRKLLEWETMAQSDTAASNIGMVQAYIYAACALALLTFGLEPEVSFGGFLLSALWISAPWLVSWLNEPPTAPGALSEEDKTFIADTALRTWRYFADYANEANHGLVPDNVQLDPPLTAARTSPTNLGMMLTANLAAHDFGFLTIGETRAAIQCVLDSMNLMVRDKGHFLNWYDTVTLQPLAPRYVSAVDSGNLAASLCTIRQGCLTLLRQPILGPGVLAGLRTHVLRFQSELPSNARPLSIMRLLSGLLRQLDSQPTHPFHWEAILTEARESFTQASTILAGIRVRQDGVADFGELDYWQDALSRRLSATLAELHALAPWLQPEIEDELRGSMAGRSLASLFELLSETPALRDLPGLYEQVSQELNRLLEQTLYPALRAAVERLLALLPAARAHALHLIQGLEQCASLSGIFFHQTDFRPFFDPARKLLRIGYNADTGAMDEYRYDLLASEARTGVFIGIAKGDLPREAWFRLGRKLTAFQNERTLLSWTGTMFEYLMPLLHMRSYENSLLNQALRAAVRIQRMYARQRKVPWGISESAYAVRDGFGQHQYRPFGVPALSANPDRGGELVIAPYASLLALPLYPAEATANLRALAAHGYRDRHGFYEAIDYSSGEPEVVRSHMAHHQGMALLAAVNALFANRMQDRFHQDPQVQATEFLLQERMPTLIETLEKTEHPAAAA